MPNKKFWNLPRADSITGNELVVLTTEAENTGADLNFLVEWFNAKPTAYDFGALNYEPVVSPFGGGPIPLGAQYFNTLSNVMRAYGSSGWYTPNLSAQLLGLSTGATLVGTPTGTVQQALDARPTSVALTDASTAANLGAAVGTVQSSLDARPTFTNLAAASTVPLMGFTAAESQGIFDNAVPLQNYTALRAYTGRGLGIRITGLYATAMPQGISGFFQRDATDVTTADNGGTVIIDGSGRRWKRIFSGNLNIAWFGALGDGFTAGDSAWTACLAEAALRKSVIDVPPGSFVHAAPLVFPDGVSARGAGSGSSILMYGGTTGTAITLGAVCTLSNLGFSYVGTPTAGISVHIVGNLSSVFDCEFTKYFVAITVGTSGTRTITPKIINCNFRAPTIATGTGAIFLVNYGNAIVKNCVGAGPLAGLQPDYGLRAHNGDTAFVSDCNFTLHGFALLMDVPVTLNNYAMTISNSYFDSANAITGTATVPSGRIGGAGNVYNMKVTGTWFGLSTTGSGLEMTATGAGKVEGTGLVNCQFQDNADAGLVVLSTAVKHTMISSCDAASNTNYGFRFVPNVGYVTITGCVADNIAGRGANGRGCTFNAGTGDYILCANNRFTNSTVANLENAGVTGTHNLFVNNLTV